MLLMLEDEERGRDPRYFAGSKIEACKSYTGFATEVERYRKQSAHAFNGAIVQFTDLSPGLV